jgi:23S rRNA pseudouridine2605 synthase
MNRKPNENDDKERIAQERIAKVMARAGLCSRREAETWILAGRVAVNGETLASPAFTVSPRDKIVVDGKPLPVRERTRLFLYHKPRGLVTTNRDERDRATVFAALPSHLPRVVSVGRLDLNSEGLLLLTNDGGLKRVLELPETGWQRRYRVRANGRITQDALDKLNKGIRVDGVEYGPIRAMLDRAQGANAWMTMTLREGKNREIRNVLRALGLTVNRLIRVSYGPFQLGELKPGAVEEVKGRVLHEQLGEKIIRQSGADFDAPVREREPEMPERPARKSLEGKKTPARARHGKFPPKGGMHKNDRPKNDRHNSDRHNNDRLMGGKHKDAKHKGGKHKPEHRRERDRKETARKKFYARGRRD